MNRGVLTFEEWIAYCFDRPVTDPEWYWGSDPSTGEDHNWFSPPIEVLADYLGRLFEQPAFLADRFTPEQLNQGFWFIFGVGSAYLSRVTDEARRDQQVRVYESLWPLYRDLFTRVCSQRVSRDGEPYGNPLDSAVCTLWDMDCVEGVFVKGFSHLWEPALTSLERILTLDNGVCQASALEGLRVAGVFGSSGVSDGFCAGIFAPAGSLPVCRASPRACDLKYDGIG